MKKEVQPALLTERETCRYLGVSRSFLAKSRVDGTLANHTPGPPYIRIGCAIRYSIEDLNDYIAKHRHEIRSCNGLKQKETSHALDN